MIRDSVVGIRQFRGRDCVYGGGLNDRFRRTLFPMSFRLYAHFSFPSCRLQIRRPPPTSEVMFSAYSPNGVRDIGPFRVTGNVQQTRPYARNPV